MRSNFQPAQLRLRRFKGLKTLEKRLFLAQGARRRVARDFLQQRTLHFCANDAAGSSSRQAGQEIRVSVTTWKRGECIAQFAPAARTTWPIKTTGPHAAVQGGQNGGGNMRFSHWFDRTHQPVPNYRPRVELSEDRTAPAGFRIFKAPPVLPATHLEVNGAVACRTGPGFLGKSGSAMQTIRSSAVSGEPCRSRWRPPIAVRRCPRVSPFSAADKGVHTFQAKLASDGEQMVDASSGALTGQALGGGSR